MKKEEKYHMIVINLDLATWPSLITIMTIVIISTISNNRWNNKYDNNDTNNNYYSNDCNKISVTTISIIIMPRIITITIIIIIMMIIRKEIATRQ